MLEEQRYKLQAKIHLLIIQAEVLGLKSLDAEHVVIKELKARYLSWVAPDGVEDIAGKPGSHFILKLQRTTKSNITLSALRANFIANRNKPFFQYAIDELESHIDTLKDKPEEKSETLPQYHHGMSVNIYKKKIFEEFLFATLGNLSSKESFQKLKKLSQDLGYTDFEYTTMLSQIAPHSDNMESIVNNNKGLSHFIYVGNLISYASVTLMLPYIALAVFPKFAEKLTLSVLQPQDLSVGLGMCKSMWPLSAEVPKDIYRTLALTASTLSCTGILLYTNKHSEDLKNIIVCFAAVKLVFDLGSTKLLEHLTASEISTTDARLL